MFHTRFCMWVLAEECHTLCINGGNKYTRCYTVTCSKLTIETVEQGVKYVQN